MNINEFGFIRVAAASPKVKVADCEYNLSEIKVMIDEAIKQHVQIICFPELSLTSYSCGDLFFQTALQEKAISNLIKLRDYLKDKPSIIVIVGLPLLVNCKLYNTAAVLGSEGVLGIVPKTYIPNSGEFYEKRWFASGESLYDCIVEIDQDKIPISKSGMIFQTPYAKFAIEICEDLWMPIPPSSYLSTHGADIIFNLSASNELIGKNSYRRSLISQQSARLVSGYVYASAGRGESTTDVVYSGACLIAENGSILAEGKRFSGNNEMIISDIDIQALRNERIKNTNYKSDFIFAPQYIEVPLQRIETSRLNRTINPHPFIPSKELEDENLNDLFNIQTYGLIKRLEHTGINKVTIGISGGLDSTLAFLVTLKSFDVMGIPRENIYAITMPGFGTTDRTYSNAIKLMETAGVTLKEINISASVKQHFIDIEHDINQHDITYENSQARERTQILMDYSNKIGGLVVGTGNLSELALGWATYNGDHMSMYGVNASIPKTLVKKLVHWIADHKIEEKAKTILLDILDTPYSPELLPADKEGRIAQKTEMVVGPYELHDFFLHRMLRHADEPKRIYYLALQAFEGTFTPEDILKWLKIYYRRFFSQQFKRSCLPDGPKVGSINLSPRGDWRMPSDAMASLWLEQLENLDISKYKTT